MISRKWLLLIFLGLASILAISVVYEITKPRIIYNSCILLDVDENTVEVKVVNGDSWTQITNMYFADEQKFVGGKVVEAENNWGFTFDPTTITVSEAPRKDLQTTFQNLTDRLPFVYGFKWFVNVTVLAIR